MHEDMSDRERSAYRIGALEYSVSELLRLVENCDGWSDSDEIVIRQARKVVEWRVIG